MLLSIYLLSIQFNSNYMGIVFTCLDSFRYKRINIDFDNIIEQSDEEFKQYISYRSNRLNLYQSIDSLGQNYLIYFSKYNPNFLKHIMSHKMKINSQDILHADNNGITTVFNIVTNKSISSDVIDQLTKTDAFTSNINNILVHTNKLNQNFIEYAIESNKMNTNAICKMIKLSPIILLENKYKRDTIYRSILAYLIFQDLHTIANAWIEKISNLSNGWASMCNTPYRYVDIVHMAMMHSEKCLISIIKHKLYIKLNIDIKKKIYITPNFDQQTVFSFACNNNMRQYVMFSLDRKLFSRSCLNQNIFQLVNIIPDDKIIKYLNNKTIPHDVFVIENNDGNTIFGESIINNQSFHQKLLEKELVTTSMLKLVNKLGNNCINLCALHNTEFLPFLYAYSKSYPDVLFCRNFEGSNFMDILTYESKVDCLYFMNFFDSSLYDSKELILRKFTTGVKLSIDEYAFLQYQYNSTVPQVNLDELTNEQECVICVTDVMNVKFNCDHTLCFKCSLLIDHCPLCRMRIHKKIMLVDV